MARKAQLLLGLLGASFAARGTIAGRITLPDGTPVAAVRVPAVPAAAAGSGELVDFFAGSPDRLLHWGFQSRGLQTCWVRPGEYVVCASLCPDLPRTGSRQAARRYPRRSNRAVSISCRPATTRSGSTARTASRWPCPCTWSRA